MSDDRKWNEAPAPHCRITYRPRDDRSFLSKIREQVHQVEWVGAQTGMKQRKKKVKIASNRTENRVPAKR